MIYIRDDLTLLLNHLLYACKWIVCFDSMLSYIAIATYSIVQYKPLSHLLVLGFFENQNLECSNSRFYKDYLKLDEKLK